MTTAASPGGPWAALQQLFASAGWDDCCPFWDDDGQGYLMVTHFADGYKIYLFKLTTDGTALVPSRPIRNHEAVSWRLAVI